MTNIVDLENFKSVLRNLKGSSSDALIVMQIIHTVDLMADMLLEQQEEIVKLSKLLASLEEVMEHLPTET
jgi:hypothetical protein